jgi:hypothetical protein
MNCDRYPFCDARVFFGSQPSMRLIAITIFGFVANPGNLFTARYATSTLLGVTMSKCRVISRTQGRKALR